MPGIRAMLLGVSVASVQIAAAQAEEPAASRWSAALEEVAVYLEDDYIYSQTGAAMARHLRENGGDYDQAADLDALAQALTEDLYDIAQDHHLRLWTQGSQAAPSQAPMSREQIEHCRTASIEHRWLAPDIGYIQFPRFRSEPDYLAGFDAAMEVLDGADAIILDLRANCGGDEMAVRHLSTYFFDRPTHLVSSQVGDSEPRERWTLDAVPGPRQPDASLYILVDNGTFSAAESFSFGMRATGRATLAGIPTGGGGHFGATVELDSGMRMFLPIGRTFDPRTGEGWEATGIMPDIRTDTSDAALDAAVADFRSPR